MNRTPVIRTAVIIAAMVSTVNFLNPAPTVASAQTAPLYKSCQEDKLTAPITLAPAAAATQAATAVATTAAASTAADIVFLNIVGSESEACYLASEVFLDNNMMGIKAGFNGAVGVTKTISGEIALDKANVANSLIGDITINVSEFQSDNPRRDGFIRQNFLQSNKFPFATLTDAVAIGLPNAAYKEGTKLDFKIKGILTVHDTKRETTFDATGTFSNGALVIRASTDLKMSEFGIEVPNIGGLLKVDDPLRLVVNIVAREGKATAATPAATAAK